MIKIRNITLVRHVKLDLTSHTNTIEAHGDEILNQVQNDV